MMFRGDHADLLAMLTIGALVGGMIVGLALLAAIHLGAFNPQQKKPKGK